MTTLARWEEPDRTVFVVNGCMATEIREDEIRSTAGWDRLLVERVAPLVWSAMPCHDEPGQGDTGAVKCRDCNRTATVAIRSGFEWHPTCGECAAWWSPDRQGPLDGVDPDYRYEERR